MHPTLATLPPEEKGFVLAAALARTPPAEAARRLDGTAGARCAAALEALAQADRTVRAAAIAELTALALLRKARERRPDIADFTFRLSALQAEQGDRRGALQTLQGFLALARAPVPAGIESVHPDWLRERLEAEPDAIVRAVTAGLPDEVRAIAANVIAARGGVGIELYEPWSSGPLSLSELEWTLPGLSFPMAIGSPATGSSAGSGAAAWGSSTSRSSPAWTAASL